MVVMCIEDGIHNALYRYTSSSAAAHTVIQRFQSASQQAHWPVRPTRCLCLPHNGAQRDVSSRRDRSVCMVLRWFVRRLYLLDQSSPTVHETLQDHTAYTSLKCVNVQILQKPPTKNIIAGSNKCTRKLTTPKLRLYVGYK